MRSRRSAAPCHRLATSAGIPSPHLRHDVRLHVSVVVLAGPHKAAAGLKALCHHVVNQAVLVPTGQAGKVWQGLEGAGQVHLCIGSGRLPAAVEPRGWALARHTTTTTHAAPAPHSRAPDPQVLKLLLVLELVDLVKDLLL